MENILWYKTQADSFEEAMPIGNGKLGAMVYGKGGVEKLSLNYDDLWSGTPGAYSRKGAYEAYKKAQELILKGEVAETERLIESGVSSEWTDMYMPLGNLYIDGLSDVDDNYRRELNLEDGVVTVKCGKGKRTYFCSYKEGAIVIRIENESDFRVYMDSELKHKLYSRDNKYILEGECPTYCMNELQTVTKEGAFAYFGDGVHFATVVKVETDGKVSYSDGIKVSDATDTVVVIHVKSSFISPHCSPDAEYLEPCIKASDSFPAFLEVYNDHIKYFNSKYDRVKLSLSSAYCDEDTLTRLRSGGADAGLVELLFNFGRYLIISASAPGSRATNLQGIWNEKFFAPWNANYTININTQMNYWPVLMCNLTEYYAPLVDLIRDVSKAGRKTARDIYHADGFCVHHNTDLWAHTTPVGDRNPGNVRWGFWNASGGWLCQHLFEYYEYTEDKEFLEKIGYPIMKESAKFYLDILVEYEGRLIVSPATSPENSYLLDGTKYSAAKWATMTQSIVSELFEACVKCCEILGIDDDFKTKLADALPKLKPYEITPDGRLMEWDKAYDEADYKHRHVSHLYSLYPGNAITTDKTPELAQACKQTLLTRGDDGTGWSLGWKVNLWSKLKDGDHSLKIIKRQLELVENGSNRTWQQGGTYPNMFDAHPPFQIDGNFGVCSGIAQMLLQCENGIIKILPALPAEYSNGSVEGLLAKGNVEVSIFWENKKATKVILKSKTDKQVYVQLDGNITNIHLKKDTPYEFTA